ncbi:hypothetical protein [Paenibacillus protaetiae]|uniref:DUF6199 domain-containing protein n=1 Tax=Paenibacillus protaetiae TaxID=2509456 RepID=A0A4P6ETR9_9BACL|nr:hypothetical protein [Paenibacillus protaetiae]QAY65453.1 hypothetical protein ET464_02735 [Paenibacillus protaetiae]
MILLFVLGSLFLGLGILAVKQPDLWIFKRTGREEITDSDIAFTKLRGLVCLIAGAIFIIAWLLRLIL